MGRISLIDCRGLDHFQDPVQGHLGCILDLLKDTERAIR